MNTKRIVRALEKWSPNGLCGGNLVQKNGVQANTEACAVGCLALEFLHSKPGALYLGKRDLKNFIRKELYGAQMIPRADLDAAVEKYYELAPSTEEDDGDIAAIMDFNDNINSDSTVVDMLGTTDLPRDVGRTIIRLRKQYEKRVEKRMEEKDRSDW